MPVTKEFGRVLSTVIRENPKSSRKAQWKLAWRVYNEMKRRRLI